MVKEICRSTKIPTREVAHKLETQPAPRKDNRIKAHFLTCFMALMFIRIVESKTHNKLTVETLIDTLKNYNFQHFEGSGYVPAYTRNETTDLLHEAFDFRTDYQIVSEKNMKKILKKTKK